MRISFLFINFTPEIVNSGSAWREFSSTEDGLSVTVSKGTTSVVQFSFFDALRSQAKMAQAKIGSGKQESAKTEPPKERLSQCLHVRDYKQRMANMTEIGGVTEETRKSIPELFWEHNVQPDDTEYIATPSKTSTACQCGLELLILVKSAISHFDRRTAIREAWGDIDDVSVNFVIGMPTTQSNETQHFNNILRESRKYNDMLIGKFWDTYGNLTKKSITALKWATEECVNFAYLGLVDDDIQLNVHKIDAELKRREDDSTTILRDFEYVHCLHMIQNRARVMRQGKWSISKADYLNEFYPQICTGAGFLMPNRAVGMLYEISKTTVPFKIDDVFISGILRVKAGLTIRGPGVFRNGTVKLITNNDVASMI